MKKRSGSREGGCRKILESCFTGHRGSRERLSGKIKKKASSLRFEWIRDGFWWFPWMFSNLDFLSSFRPFHLLILFSFSHLSNRPRAFPTFPLPYISSSSRYLSFFFFLSFKYFCSFSFFGSIFGIFRGSDQMFKARCPRKMLNVMKENWFNTDNNK